ncbi:MAG: hypothetical protein KGH65_05230 [Candidatus Micrarchaeota archaeon]|nr:hypothetical protein [Candidatus Micrarchaeota archaeon]
MANTIRSKDAGTSTGSGRMTDERLEWHCENWARWMRSGESVTGYPKAAIGLRSVGQSHFDDMAEASDKRCAIACNAIIEGLAPAQAAALYRQYLWAVFRFPRDNFVECLEMGKSAVRSGLEKRGFW